MKKIKLFLSVLITTSLLSISIQAEEKINIAEMNAETDIKKYIGLFRTTYEKDGPYDPSLVKKLFMGSICSKAFSNLFDDDSIYDEGKTKQCKSSNASYYITDSTESKGVVTLITVKFNADKMSHYSEKTKKKVKCTMELKRRLSVEVTDEGEVQINDKYPGQASWNTSIWGAEKVKCSSK